MVQDQPTYAPPKLSVVPPFTETHLPPGQAPPNCGPRPLSDIRELSEPSIIDNVVRRPGNAHQREQESSRANSLRSRTGVTRKGSSRLAQTRTAKDATSARSKTRAISRSPDPVSSSYSSTPERTSLYNIPQSSVPQRSSSQTHAQRPTVGSIRHHARKPSMRNTPSTLSQSASHGCSEGLRVPNYGPSNSPVRRVKERLDAARSDGIGGRRTSSRTYLRTPHPTDILEFPSYRHPRIKLELQVSAPLFVGGGSIEGQVKITVDENEKLKHRRSLGLGAVSVDLIGYEDVGGGRRASFLAVGTDVVDTSHPPPGTMAEPSNPLAPEEKFWTLVPSASALPFMVSLPLDTGPPPFESKHANIRFLLCATALIRDAGKHYRVRTSHPVSVLSTYDPEKALTSLPSPLVATDEVTLRRFGRCETATLTAGLHRQVWVSGSSIFVDVHLANKTHKPVRKLDLSLERDILCYKHAPAATSEKSASQARIFESNEQVIITRTTLKAGLQSWNGIEAHESETRTFELPLPRGHATVRCGKFFEVRFFLNVTASLANSKTVSVQLPITLIHINSLDVLPNSVAQVAAAIEEKRAQSQRSKSKSRRGVHARQRSASSPAAMVEMRRRPSYTQGRAFAAPRQQEYERQKAAKADLQALSAEVDRSPRKFGIGRNLKAMESQSSLSGLSSDFGHAKPKEQNSFAELAFKTPGTGRRRIPVHEGLARMQSASSVKSRSSKKAELKQPTITKPLRPNGPPYHFTVLKEQRIDPQALGLSSARGRPAQDSSIIPSIEPYQRPGTGLSFRDRLERSRFEFKGVRRKGSIKEAGIGLWESVKAKAKDRDRDRDDGGGGWI